MKRKRNRLVFSLLISVLLAVSAVSADPDDECEPGETGDDSCRQPVPVPEPSTILLLGSGLAGLCAFKRRMNKT